jgi:hypothetical protein
MSYFAGSNTYNVCVETEISNILSHFNTQFIFDVIKDNINNRTSYIQMLNGNIPASFEQYFKQIKMRYTGDIQTIDQVRIDTYREIIKILCNECKLQYIESQIQDYYSAAYYLYDFLVANFTNNLVGFFANYIIKEKNGLYDSLKLNEYKKNKDSSTSYSKKIYKNIKLAIINSNLDYVIDNICVFDISFQNILSTVYFDKNVIKYIESIVTPLNDFFKMYYVSLIQSNLRPILLTNIRLEIQKLSVFEDINIIKTDK